MIQKFTKLEFASYILLFGAMIYSLTVFAPHDALLQFNEVETYAAIGAVMAAVVFLVLRVLPNRNLMLERGLYALFLGCMPLVYLGAALIDGHDLMVELIGTAIFMGIALVGFFRSFPLLAIGIIAHGLGWDLWHHDPLHYGYISSWYPPTCLLVDLALGLLAITQIKAHRQPDNSLQGASPN